MSDDKVNNGHANIQLTKEVHNIISTAIELKLYGGSTAEIKFKNAKQANVFAQNQSLRNRGIRTNILKYRVQRRGILSSHLDVVAFVDDRTALFLRPGFHARSRKKIHHI
jgi:hypothetical protein